MTADGTKYCSPAESSAEQRYHTGSDGVSPNRHCAYIIREIAHTFNDACG